jgi:hypothetical protein
VAEGLTLGVRRLGIAPDRFGVALAGLGLVLIGAVGGAAVWGLQLTGGASRGMADWSTWQPTGTGFRGAEEIAEHVWTVEAAVDRAPATLSRPFSVDPSASVKPPRFHALVVHGRGGSLRVVSQKTVGYSMCGAGDACALPFDTLNQRRLVRRQALALALYSLAYLEVERVVVVLPPRPGDDQPVSALFFNRADLVSSLNRPLRKTLNLLPPTESQLDGEIGARLDRLTIPYQYEVDQVAAAGDSFPVLTLSPLDEA